MADTKVYAGGRLSYWWVPDGGIADIEAPTVAEIEAGVNISRAIAVDSTEVTPQDSSDIDDRAITDAGNAVEPGFDQYAAAINAFRPSDPSDMNDPYAVLYNLFKTQRVKGYIVKRRVVEWDDAVAEGDMISVFYVLSDYTSNDTAGEDSVKFMIQFLPQGQMSVNTFVAYASETIVAAPDTVTATAGDVEAVVATLDVWDITQGATWSSDDTAIATVSESGVVTAIASGSATVTVSHPSGDEATVTVTVS